MHRHDIDIDIEISNVLKIYSAILLLSILLHQQMLKCLLTVVQS